MVSLMFRGVQHRVKGRQHMTEKMAVGDISGPPLGAGLHVPTKNRLKCFLFCQNGPVIILNVQDSCILL